METQSLPLQKKGGGGAPQIFGPCLLWPNGWMDQDAIWHEGRPQPRRLCARWGRTPYPQRGWSPLPNFRPISTVAGCIKMPLRMEVVFSPRDYVLDGDPVPPPPKRGGAEPPKFSAHVYCGQTPDGSRCHLSRR